MDPPSRHALPSGHPCTALPSPVSHIIFQLGREVTKWTRRGRKEITPSLDPTRPEYAAGRISPGSPSSSMAAWMYAEVQRPGMPLLCQRWRSGGRRWSSFPHRAPQMPRRFLNRLTRMRCRRQRSPACGSWEAALRPRKEMKIAEEARMACLGSSVRLRRLRQPRCSSRSRYRGPRLLLLGGGSGLSKVVVDGGCTLGFQAHPA